MSWLNDEVDRAKNAKKTVDDAVKKRINEIQSNAAKMDLMILRLLSDVGAACFGTRLLLLPNYKTDSKIYQHMADWYLSGPGTDFYTAKYFVHISLGGSVSNGFGLSIELNERYADQVQRLHYGGCDLNEASLKEALKPVATKLVSKL